MLPRVLTLQHRAVEAVFHIGTRPISSVPLLTFHFSADIFYRPARSYSHPPDDCDREDQPFDGVGLVECSFIFPHDCVEAAQRSRNAKCTEYNLCEEPFDAVPFYFSFHFVLLSLIGSVYFISYHSNNIYMRFQYMGDFRPP